MPAGPPPITQILVIVRPRFVDGTNRGARLQYPRRRRGFNAVVRRRAQTPKFGVSPDPARAMWTAEQRADSAVGRGGKGLNAAKGTHSAVGTARSYDLLDRPEVIGTLFYPRREIGVPKLAAGVHTVRIPVADGVEIGGKIFAATAGAPLILYFHGNGEIASDYDTIAPLYTRIGITLFVVDYRGYGLSTGSPTASALIADARTCFEKAPELLAARDVAVGATFVMGRSLGSAAAIDIARNAPDRIAGLIIESGFAYTFPLIERIGFLQIPDAFESRDGFGNLDKIAEVTMPTLLIHGERDWIIPISDAEALYDASPAADKKFVRVPAAGHNDLMLVGSKPYFAAIAEFCGTAPHPA
jgi:hypothetical protein